MSRNRSQIAGRDKSAFWRRAALLSCIASTAVYIAHDAYPVKNGGTPVGLALGVIAASIIVLLMTLGIRKRSYKSTLGTVSGWVSAHIYLGLSLVVIATLHSGFQFGVNLHGATWLLMCIVIGTGIWGVSSYKRYPQLLHGNRKGLSLELMIDELNDFDSQLTTNSSGFPEDIVQLIDSSISETVIGGGVRAQINSIDHSKIKLPGQPRVISNSRQVAALSWLTTELAENRIKKRGKDLKDAIDAVTYREILLEKIREHIRIKAKLKLWLVFHVPLSLGLVAAVAAHIIAVTAYR
jgi:hypothetical protein